MKIETAFSNGDKAWCFEGAYCRELTIGRIEVKVTDSRGEDDDSMFDNYKPQSGYEERYMCVETGIGSGSVYTLNEHIFATKELCEAANAKEIKERAEAKERQRLYEREQLLRDEQGLLYKLERIQAAKAEAAAEAAAKDSV